LVKEGSGLPVHHNF